MSRVNHEQGRHGWRKADLNQNKQQQRAGELPPAPMARAPPHPVSHSTAANTEAIRVPSPLKVLNPALRAKKTPST